MKTNKITVKLSIFFAIALIIFSIIISGMFIFFFRNYTINIYKNQLYQRANAIAATLSEFNAGSQRGMGMGSYGAYLRYISDIADSNVWVVDENLNIMTTMPRGRMNERYHYKDLPENAENVVKEVFDGKTVFSEEFGKVFSELTLTVGVPFLDGNNTVVGVVLLHSPVSGIDDVIWKGVAILLICIGIALIVVILLSIKFSLVFTKPLNKINAIALKLSAGDYNVKTEIVQNDEIGELAHSMDILSHRLMEANNKSMKLDKLRRDFVANISHELKTPITVIRGSLEAIIDEVVTSKEDLYHYNMQMLGETIFLERLVGDLLDLSRLQNTEFSMNMDDVDVFELIDDVTRSATQLATKKGVTIKTLKTGVSKRIKGDYHRLRQMIMIVLDNAIKFSKENANVEITLDNKELMIHDYGMGIKEEDLQYIFDRFYKTRVEENKVGTGLGLAIAKQIADRHSIKLTVESTFGVETLFRFQWV